MDLTRLRQSSNDHGTEPQYFTRIPGRLVRRTESAGDQPGEHPSGTFEILRDPFATIERPILFYNTAFGPLGEIIASRLIDLVINSGDWDIVGLTEFEIECRGIPFNTHAWEAFRKGKQVLWVWDREQALKRGPPSRSLLTMRLTAAVAARRHHAEIVIGEIRDKVDAPKEGRSPHSEYFVDRYYGEVLGCSVNEDGEYPRRLLGEDDKYKEFEEFYGLSALEFRDRINSEIEFYGYLYKGAYVLPKRLQLEKILDREFDILKTLESGYRRAHAVQTLTRASKSSKKWKSRKEDEQVRTLDALRDTENCDLATSDYFIIALHAGLNLEILHEGLAPVTRYLDVAVWLGRLGRSDGLRLVPEICEAFRAVLNLHVPSGSENKYLREIFVALRSHAQLFTDIDRLTSAIEQTLMGSEAPVIERRVFGEVVSVRRNGKNLPISDYGSLIEFATDGHKSLLAKWTTANRPSELRLSIPNSSNDDDQDGYMVVQPFVPRAW
ncbi:hypothetical protein [Afipia carboxidovorans]|jgi:hypothetical protein|uniref:hypothetical protein n=1 Tax=Afipia carboxidovorans TaxID=40137 RepID=UPI00308B1E03|nr:hypothetical protein CRBSH125_22820 [Afipia carboxidovorans]